MASIADHRDVGGDESEGTVLALTREALLTRIAMVRRQVFGLADLTGHHTMDPAYCSLMDAIQRVNYELGALEEMLEAERPRVAPTSGPHPA